MQDMVKQETLSFCRNYFDGVNFVMFDDESVYSKRHTAYANEIVYTKFNSFEAYKKFGFGIVIRNTVPDKSKQGICWRSAQASHGIPRTESSVVCSSEIPTPKKPHRKGIRCNTPLNKISFERKTMKDSFRELCKEFSMDGLIQNLVEEHHFNNVHLCFTGDIVGASICGIEVSPVASLTIVSAGPELASRCIVDAGFKFGAQIRDGCMIVGGVYNNFEAVYCPYIRLMYATSDNFERVRNSDISFRNTEFFGRCTYDGKVFTVLNYDDFIETFATTYPCLETRDVYVDYKGFALFGNSAPLTFKAATMMDYFNKTLEGFGEHADVIHELLELPNAVIVGRMVANVMKGKFDLDYVPLNMVCFDILQVLGIMNKHKYVFPGAHERYVNDMSFLVFSFKCPSGKDSIHIRIPNLVGEHTSFVENFLKENYVPERRCTFDGQKFTTYGETKKEYPIDSLPI